VIYVKFCHETKVQAFAVQKNTDYPQPRFVYGPQFEAWTRNHKSEPDIHV